MENIKQAIAAILAIFESIFGSLAFDLVFGRQ